MPIKPLIILPDPVLRQTARPIETIDSQLRKLAESMLATMYDAHGNGLATIQCGETVRMLVIDLSKKDQPKATQIFINPETLSSSE